MKLFQIALSLFNIFAISVALVPKNVEIVMKQYVEPSTGDLQQGVYEKRYNYLEEGEKYPEAGNSLFKLESLKNIQTKLTGAAKAIVDDYYKIPEHEPKSGDFKLKADEVAEFTVTYTGLTVEDLSDLLQKQPNAKRISGKVEIGPKTDLEGRAAAAAAEPPSDLNVTRRPDSAPVTEEEKRKAAKAIVDAKVKAGSSPSETELEMAAEKSEPGSPRPNSAPVMKEEKTLYRSSYFKTDAFNESGLIEGYSK